MASTPPPCQLPSDHAEIEQYSSQCVATLKGHSAAVAALAAAGKSLYSGSADRSIRLWDQNSVPSSVALTKSPVKSLLVCGHRLFSSHQDHKIRVWKIAGPTAHKPCAVLPTARDRLLKLLSPKNHVQVRRHKTRTWVHHVDAVSGLAVSPDGALLYSVSWDRSLKVWRTSDFRCMESVAGAHDDAINAVAVSSDGFVYTGSADARIKVWRRPPGGQAKHSLVSTLERHRSAVNALAVSGDGRVLYSGSADRSVVVWEGGGGVMVAASTLRGHRMAVLCLAAAGELVCSGSADGTVRVWRRRRREDKAGYGCVAVLEGHGGGIKSLSVVAVDGCCRESACGGGGCTHHVYSGGLDCDVKVWKLLAPTFGEGGSNLLMPI